MSLSVQKPNGDYWFVQDLRAVMWHPYSPNGAKPIHPPRPRIGKAQYFSVLDLKDAFFCIPLHPDSQYLFVFEWRDPDTLEATQYTWTVLPQGFGTAPIFLEMC